jgi:hypothetical protein
LPRSLRQPEIVHVEHTDVRTAGQHGLERVGLAAGPLDDDPLAVAAIGAGAHRGEDRRMHGVGHEVQRNRHARLARETPGAGARATLPGEVCVMALGAVFDEASDVAVRDALADVDAAVAPYRAGEYPNFVEMETDASGFFAPAVWDRLRDVKRRHDPADLFTGGHCIPPAEPAIISS